MGFILVILFFNLVSLLVKFFSVFWNFCDCKMVVCSMLCLLLILVESNFSEVVVLCILLFIFIRIVGLLL